MKYQYPYIVKIASVRDYKFSAGIVQAINDSAKERGVELPPRSEEFIKEKIKNGLAVIAVSPDHKEWLGFSYIEVWRHQKYVANSGLIVKEKYRGIGISGDIKKKIFDLSRIKFPFAKMFSLSANPAVIHANFELGFKIVPYEEILHDHRFLTGFDCLVDYIEMMRNGTESSHHLAMVFDPLSTLHAEELTGIKQIHPMVVSHPMKKEYIQLSR